MTLPSTNTRRRAVRRAVRRNRRRPSLSPLGVLVTAASALAGAVLAIGPVPAAFAHTDQAWGAPGTYDYRYPFPSMMTVGVASTPKGDVATFTAGMPYVDPVDAMQHPHQEVTAIYTLQESPVPAPNRLLSWRDMETKTTSQQLDRPATDGVPGSAFVSGTTFATTLRDLGSVRKYNTNLYRLQVYLIWRDTTTGKTLGARQALATQASELTCASGPSFICTPFAVPQNGQTIATVRVG